MRNHIAINGQKEILFNHLNNAVEAGYDTVEQIKRIAIITFKKENKETILSYLDYQEVFNTYFN